MNDKEFDETYSNRRLDTEAYNLSHFMDTQTNWNDSNKPKDLETIHRIKEMQATIKLLKDESKKGRSTFRDLKNLEDNFFYQIARKNILKFQDEYGYSP